MRSAAQRERSCSFDESRSFDENTQRGLIYCVRSLLHLRVNGGRKNVAHATMRCTASSPFSLSCKPSYAHTFDIQELSRARGTTCSSNSRSGVRKYTKRKAAAARENQYRVRALSSLSLHSLHSLFISKSRPARESREPRESGESGRGAARAL